MHEAGAGIREARARHRELLVLQRLAQLEAQRLEFGRRDGTRACRVQRLEDVDEGCEPVGCQSKSCEVHVVPAASGARHRDCVCFRALKSERRINERACNGCGTEVELQVAEAEQETSKRRAASR